MRDYHVSVVLPFECFFEYDVEEMASNLGHVEFLIVCECAELPIDLYGRLNQLTQSYDVKFFYLNKKSNSDGYIFSIGRLAKYRLVLFWWINQAINPSDLHYLTSLKTRYSVLGLSGLRKANLQEFFNTSSWVANVDEVTQVDYLHKHAILLHRKILFSPFFNQQSLNSQSFCFNLSRYLLDNKSRLIVVPTTTEYGIDAPSWCREDYIKYTYLYLNANYDRKNWKQINSEILPFLESGTHFRRLHSIQNPAILVMGCQRSGTTWMNRLVGKFLSSVFSLTENETFDFLLDGLNIPNELNKNYTLCLQTTFIVCERESYLNAPTNSVNICLIRNPLSVCWSLLYHFNAFDMVWDYRSSQIPQKLTKRFNNNLTRVEKAILLYLDSIYTFEILKMERPETTVVVDFDCLVNNTESTIHQIGKVCQNIWGNKFVSFPSQNPEFDLGVSSPELATLVKYKTLPPEEYEMIESNCYAAYTNLLTEAINVKTCHTEL